MQLSMFGLSKNEITEELLKLLKENNRDTDFVVVKNNKEFDSVFFFDFKIFAIKEAKSSFFILFNVNEKNLLSSVEDKLKVTKSSLNFEITNLDDLYLLKNFILNKYDYSDKATLGKGFGCCSRFLECSDNLSCVLDDKFRKRECAYNTNLSKGIVIYGNNRNID